MAWQVIKHYITPPLTKVRLHTRERPLLCQDVASRATARCSHPGGTKSAFKIDPLT